MEPSAQGACAAEDWGGVGYGGCGEGLKCKDGRKGPGVGRRGEGAGRGVVRAGRTEL